MVVVLHALDTWTTIRALSQTDAREANPIARVLWNRLGPAGLVLLKAGGFYWLYKVTEGEYAHDADVQVAQFAFVGLFAVVNNLAELHEGPGLKLLWTDV